MVSFWVYDVTFLILFTIFITWFLKKEKKKLAREGIMFMYRTQVGIKAINYIGTTYKKTLRALATPIIILGFILMAGMLWMLWRTLSIYIFYPEITQIIKAPPIAPLIPYFPQLFGMSSFFPPFYFTYFLLALAIVAVVHETAHGIYMKLYKVKIKSTGLVFLGPILGAFVEQEEKSFRKKKNKEQMTILAAGVAANTLTTIIFYLLYAGFFILAFQPSGYIFSSYSMSAVPINAATNLTTIDGGFEQFTYQGKNYLLDENLKQQLNIEGLQQLAAYDDAPAIKHKLNGAIIAGNDKAIRNAEELQAFLKDKEPGEKITITTDDTNKIQTYELTLTEHPDGSGKGFLGVGHNQAERGGLQKILGYFMKFKEPTTYYKPIIDGNFMTFTLHLLWWIMIINLLVALFNMLPLGILDGGRFFYLAILSITKSEQTATRAYKTAGYLIALVFFLMMILWGIGII